MSKKIKVWYLSSCITCKKILEELNLNSSNSILIDIKYNKITANELKEIQNIMKCSYEDLFNKRSQKYRTIKDFLREDNDFKQAILCEYTFLKRPIIQIGDEYFVGNSKHVVGAARDKLS